MAAVAFSRIGWFSLRARGGGQCLLYWRWCNGVINVTCKWRHGKLNGNHMKDQMSFYVGISKNWLLSELKHKIPRWQGNARLWICQNLLPGDLEQMRKLHAFTYTGCYTWNDLELQELSKWPGLFEGGLRLTEAFLERYHSGMGTWWLNILRGIHFLASASHSMELRSGKLWWMSIPSLLHRPRDQPLSSEPWEKKKPDVINCSVIAGGL